MSKQRYEISDNGWELVADLVNKPHRTGRPQANDRIMLNGVFWVLCSGATWRDTPERYGPWSTVYQRFRDWRNHGTVNKMLKRMHFNLNEQWLIDLGTSALTQPQSEQLGPHLGQAKKGQGEPAEHAPGRSRAGLKTKMRMASDALGSV